MHLHYINLSDNQINISHSDNPRLDFLLKKIQLIDHIGGNCLQRTPSKFTDTRNSFRKWNRLCLLCRYSKGVVLSEMLCIWEWLGKISCKYFMYDPMNRLRWCRERESSSEKMSKLQILSKNEACAIIVSKEIRYQLCHGSKVVYKAITSSVSCSREDLELVLWKRNFQETDDIIINEFHNNAKPLVAKNR